MQGEEHSCSNCRNCMILTVLQPRIGGTFCGISGVHISVFLKKNLCWKYEKGQNKKIILPFLKVVGSERVNTSLYIPDKVVKQIFEEKVNKNEQSKQEK